MTTVRKDGIGGEWYNDGYPTPNSRNRERIEPVCGGRNEIEMAMKREKYNNIWEFVERVERRAEREIEKTHEITGAHFRAMFAELRILEKELECY